MRFSWLGAAGSISPSLIGCLHLGQRPKVRGCFVGLLGGVGILPVLEIQTAKAIEELGMAGGHRGAAKYLPRH
jgi:hypothetical protein